MKHIIKDETVYSDPQIATFVRKLLLSGLPSPRADPVAWTVLARLTRVTDLTICDLEMSPEWPCITLEDRDAFRRTFPNIDTLYIHNDSFLRMEDFLFFLTAFPNVTSLKLYDLSFDMSTDISTDVSGFPIQPLEHIPCPLLRLLDITYDIDLPEGTDVPRLLAQWITPLSQIAKPSFKLVWFQDNDDDSAAFSQFVKALAPVLSTLEVTLPGGISNMGTFLPCSSTLVGLRPTAIFAVDLGVWHCGKVESVTLSILCATNYGFDEEEEEEETQDNNTWVYNILYQLPTTHLKIITLDLSEKSVADLHRDGPNLAQIDDLLAQQHFDHVQVVIVLPSTVDMPKEERTRGILQMVLRFLPNLCSKQEAKFAWQSGWSTFPLRTFPGLQTSLRGLGDLD